MCANSHGTTSGQQQHYVQVCCFELHRHIGQHVYTACRDTWVRHWICCHGTYRTWNHVEISPQWKSHVISPHVTSNKVISPQWRSHLTWSSHLTCRSHLSGDITSRGDFTARGDITSRTAVFSNRQKYETSRCSPFTPLTKHQVPQPTVIKSPLVVKVLLIIPTPHFIKIPQKA
jgi:hypothetical protein